VDSDVAVARLQCSFFVSWNVTILCFGCCSLVDTLAKCTDLGADSGVPSEGDELVTRLQAMSLTEGVFRAVCFLLACFFPARFLTSCS